MVSFSVCPNSECKSKFSGLTTKVTNYDFQFVVREAGQSQNFLFLTARVKLEIAEKYCRFTQEYKSEPEPEFESVSDSDSDSEEYFLEGRLNLRNKDGTPLTWMIFLYLSLPFDEEDPAEAEAEFYDFNIFGISARRFRWEQLKLKKLKPGLKTQADAKNSNETHTKVEKLAEEIKTIFVQKHTDFIQSHLQKYLKVRKMNLKNETRKMQYEIRSNFDYLLFLFTATRGPQCGS